MFLIINKVTGIPTYAQEVTMVHSMNKPGQKLIYSSVQKPAPLQKRFNI